MNPTTIKKRFVRLLTSPPEILHALTRHWFQVILVFAAGLAGTWYIIQGTLNVYEGSARLIVNPMETFVVSEIPRQPVFGRSTDEIGRFLNSQVSIISSDAVIFNLAKKLGVQNENPNEDGKKTEPPFLSEWKDRFDTLMGGESPVTKEASTPESRLQRYVEGFRLRSEVLPDLKGSGIDLRVRFLQKDLILKELNAWITAYTEQIEKMATESWEAFLSNRIEFYQTLENEENAILEGFKLENPGVSLLNEEFLNQEIARLQIYRDDIRRLEEQGITPADLRARPGSLEPDQGTAAQRRAIENEIAEWQSKGYTEESDKIKQLRRKLELLEKAGNAEDGSKEAPEAKNSGEKLSEKLTKELEKLIVGKIALKEKMNSLAQLEANYQRSREKRASYERMRQESLDMIASRKSVQIQVADVRVSSEPLNKTSTKKVVFGAVAALGLGILIALLREATSGKLRFPQDIVEDYGLPVVAVVPKR